MPRRIEVELTSSRADGTWTWRAAGARQPKGELDGGLLFDGAKVGDVVRADADFAIEGITITAVLPPKGHRPEPDRIEIIGPPRKDEPGVTTVLAPKGRRERRDGRDGRDGRDRDSRGPRDGRDRGPREGRGDRPGREGGRPGGRDGDPRGRRPGTGPGTSPGGGSGDRRERRPRPPRPAPEPKPRARRLKAGRTHRNEVLAALPETHRPIAEILLRGGLPSVRQAVDRQNELLAADGKPVLNPEPLMDIADRLMPALRTAEWRDKAEAALADAEEVDIRDLRSVVVAADAAARDEETRALADQLRDAVSARVDREHHAWLAEITENLDEGRVVRALRLSSRPPKAGAPFPAELSRRLAEATGASLTADVTADRYATVLDALTYSPVRLQVEPASVPAEPSPELLAAVRKSAGRLPQIAARFGIEAPAGRPRGGRGGAQGASRPAPIPPPPSAPIPPPPSAPAPAAPAAGADAPTEPSVEVPPADAPAEAIGAAATAPTAPAGEAVSAEAVSAEAEAPAVEADAPVAD